MCFSKWSMHFFLKCMCFTRKGMCSSTMNNVPNGTTLYYLAGISTALHIHSLLTMSPALREDTHPVTLRCWRARAERCSPGKHKREWGAVQLFCMWMCLLNGQETYDFSSPALYNPEEGKTTQLTRMRFYCLS